MIEREAQIDIQLNLSGDAGRVIDQLISKAEDAQTAIDKVTSRKEPGVARTTGNAGGGDRYRRAAGDAAGGGFFGTLASKIGSVFDAISRAAGSAQGPVMPQNGPFGYQMTGAGGMGAGGWITNLPGNARAWQTQPAVQGGGMPAIPGTNNPSGLCACFSQALTPVVDILHRTYLLHLKTTTARPAEGKKETPGVESVGMMTRAGQAVAALAAGFAAGLATLHAVGQAASFGANAINLGQNPTMMNSEMTRTFVEGLPLVGRFWGQVGELIDSLKNVRRRFLELAISQDRYMTVLRASSAVEERERELRRQNQVRQAEAMSFVGRPLAPYQTFNRMTALGQIERQEYQHRQGAQDELVRAQRREAAAQTAVQMQRPESAEAQSAFERSQRRMLEARANLERHVRAPGTGFQAGEQQVERMRLANQLTQRAGEMQRDQDRLERARQTELERSTALQQAQNAVVQARIGLLRSELEIIQMREQRMTQTAQRVGGMSRGERRGALRALQVVRRLGDDAAERVPQLVERAAAIAPQEMASLRERSGARFLQDNVANLGEVGGKDWQQSLAQVRQAEDTAMANLRTASDDAARRNAENMAEIFSRFLNQMVEIMNQRVRTALADLLAKQNAQWANRNNGG